MAFLGTHAFLPFNRLLPDAFVPRRPGKRSASSVVLAAHDYHHQHHHHGHHGHGHRGFTSAHVVDDFARGHHARHPAATRGRFSGLHLHHHADARVGESSARHRTRHKASAVVLDAVPGRKAGAISLTARAAPSRCTRSNSSRLRRQRTAATTPHGSNSPADAPSANSNLVTVISMLQSFDISIEDCGRLVARHPSLLLSLSLPADLDALVAFLSSPPLSLRTNRAVGRAIRNAPQLFARVRSPAVLRRRIDFLLNEVRVPAGALGDAVARRPHVLWMDLERAREVVRWLETKVGVPKGKVGEVVGKVPQVLLGGVEGGVAGNGRFLEEVLGMGPKEAGRFIVRYPQVLCLRVEETLMKRVDFLKGLGVEGYALRNVVEASPEILEESIEATLKKKLEVLEKRGLGAREDVKQILTKAPSLFNTNITEHLDWLKSLGLTDEQVATVVRNLPAVLIYSIPTNLEPKWNYLRRVIGGTADDLVKMPLFFGYNLEQRIMPRYAFVGMKGIRDSMTPPQILTGSDREFCHLARLDYQEFRVFEETGGSLLYHTPMA